MNLGLQLEIKIIRSQGRWEQRISPGSDEYQLPSSWELECQTHYFLGIIELHSPI